MKKPEAVFLKQPPARETISCPFRVRAADATRTLPNGGGNSYVQVYAGHRYFLTVLHRAMQCVRAAFAPRLNALRVSTRSIIAPLAQRSTHWRGIVTNPQHFLLQQLGFRGSAIAAQQRNAAPLSGESGAAQLDGSTPLFCGFHHGELHLERRDAAHAVRAA